MNNSTIDLGHGFIGGKKFDEFIRLEIPKYDSDNLRDYTSPGGDVKLLQQLTDGFGVTKSNLTLTLSTNLSLFILLNKIRNEGKTLHTLYPTFSCFNTQFDSIENISIKRYEYLDIEFILKNASKGDYLLLVNPSNPTGDYISYEKILNVLVNCRKKGITVIIDSTWIYTVYDLDDHTIELKRIINQVIRHNHILLFGLSKILFSPGIRLSCVFGLEEHVSYIAKMHDVLAISCSYFDQEFVKGNILKGRVNYKEINNILSNNVKFISDYIDRSNLLKIQDVPNSGIFMLIYTNNKIDFYDLEKEMGVIVYPGLIFGVEKNCFRICIAKDLDSIIDGLSKIELYLSKNKV